MSRSTEKPTGTAYDTNGEIVICGDPPPDGDWLENDPRRHNCDAMGCARLHVLHRIPYRNSTESESVRIQKLARKTAKRELVLELLESDRIIREDTVTIKQLRDEVQRLKESNGHD